MTDETYDRLAVCFKSGRVVKAWATDWAFKSQNGSVVSFKVTWARGTSVMPTFALDDVESVVVLETRRSRPWGAAYVEVS